MTEPDEPTWVTPGYDDTDAMIDRIDAELGNTKPARASRAESTWGQAEPGGMILPASQNRIREAVGLKPL